jgi:enoyl-CoA hydratase/carnithine racemase
MSVETMSALLELTHEAMDDHEVGVVVYTGAGDRAFCAGGDLSGSFVDDPIGLHTGRGDIARLFSAMTRGGKPTVARVNGHALAGGFGLAVACDITICVDDAKLGTSEVKVGLWPMMISAVLARVMPRKAALEMMLTGRMISPEEAQRLGAVSRVVPRADLDQAVDEVVDTLLALSPTALLMGKDAFNAMADADLGDDPVILVDHNRARGFDGAANVCPFAVIDHHPGDGRGETFTDVRTEYGAVASLVGEYFRDIGARPVPPDDHESEVNAAFTVPTEVATGLLYGILSDTDDLTRGAGPADFDVAGYLRPGVDEERLDRVANPQVSTAVLEAKARAIAGREVRGPFAVSDVGTLSNADALPQAADELAALEGVTAVVVCGEVDGVVRLSGRSRDDRVHMGRVMQRVVDDRPEATGGGHARMGGG